MMQGIYKIRNKISGKYYVGSSSDVDRRWQEHRRVLKKGRHFNILLQRAWNKYGEVAFEFTLVEAVKDTNILKEYEQKYLNEGFLNHLVYNIAPNALGGDLGEVANHKRSESLKIYFRIHGHHTKGTRHSKETRRRSSESHKGFKHTEESRRKMRGHTNNAKPYPAFINVLTGQYIPSGVNLVAACKEHELVYDNILKIKHRVNDCTRDGWQLVG